MIKGNKVTLKLFETEEEVILFSKLHNNLHERGIYDHTEMKSVSKRLNRFRETGYWDFNLGNLMILDEMNKFVGTIGFSRVSKYELSIGYRLLYSDARGKGYMTEAVSLFTKHLFSTIPGIIRLSLQTASNNAPSKRVAEKCGFVHEGTLRKAYYYRDEFHDFDIYSLLKE